jgi:hypothetical protein
MTLFDYSFVVSALAISAWLSFRLPWGLLVGIIVFVALTSVPGFYHKVMDPEYDSMAPVLWLFISWIPATIYCGGWSYLGMCSRRRQRQREADETKCDGPAKNAL